MRHFRNTMQHTSSVTMWNRQAFFLEREEQTDAVMLSTMHSSKGLEYRVVYILDANEGVTPHNKAVLDADIEEERRLFYVAMTRAKQRLHIYSVKNRYHKPAELSRFVEEYLEKQDGKE